MTVISKIERKARKSYACDNGCRRPIKSGDRYFRLYGYAHRGDIPWVVRICHDCEYEQRLAEAHGR